MSEVKKIATRDSYGNALAELGKEFDNLVVLDADLAGATKTSVFQKAFPERHIDCGIAEANMTGIAAGLSTCGKVPFASSFARAVLPIPLSPTIRGTSSVHKTSSTLLSVSVKFIFLASYIIFSFSSTAIFFALLLP